MRVLALTNLLPSPLMPHRAPFNRDLLHFLSLEHSVRGIAPIEWVDEIRARRKGAAGLPRDRKVLLDGNLIHHPSYIYPPRILRGYYGYFYRTCVRSAFSRAVAEFRPDILFVTWAYPDGWAGVQLARRYGLPVVVLVHGSDVLLGRQIPGRSKRTAEAMRAADGVIAVSQDLVSHLESMGVSRQKIRLCYTGIDRDLFSPGSQALARERLGIAESSPQILFIGNLAPVKGIPDLIDACSILHEMGINVHLNIIGQGLLKLSLENRVFASGLSRFITFRGSLPRAALPDWYRASDIFVLPSYSEGVPNVLKEAASCQIPFVATRVGGTAEIAHIGQSRLVEPGRPQELAEAIAAELERPRSSSPGPGPRRREESAAEIGQYLTEVAARWATAGRRRRLVPPAPS